jgi:endonuclease III
MEQSAMVSILDALEKTYYDATCALEFSNPFEMLISTILSAQCTDRQVNKVTESLFLEFPTPAHFAALTPEELEPHVKSCGVYKNKARNIVLTCRALLERFDGRVPDTMEELTSLPGVGRKTANVVLSNAFGQDAIAVDTHVFRVSNRIGLGRGKTPEEVERQLRLNIPQHKWSAAHHWIIRHGRQICSARKPCCAQCPVVQWCEYKDKIFES